MHGPNIGLLSLSNYLLLYYPLVWFYCLQKDWGGGFEAAGVKRWLSSLKGINSMGKVGEEFNNGNFVSSPFPTLGH